MTIDCYTLEMSRRRSQFKSGRSFAAGHQRSWLWGRHAVTETLAAGRWPVLELVIDEELPDDQVQEVQTFGATNDVDVTLASAARLSELCQSEDHQGFLARMGEFPCGTLEELTQSLQNGVRTLDGSGRPLPFVFAVCDRIHDAHNFGAILRSCDAMRCDGVIIGERYQVSITPHVARSSAGAVNHQAIFRVPSLSAAIDELKKFDVQTLAASEKADTNLWNLDCRRNVAVVIGSEATGIDAELLSRCDLMVSIPMLGTINSLNAAVAAGIMLHEIRRQQFSVV